MTMEKLITEMFENDVRAECIVHLGTQVQEDSWPSYVSDLFEENLDRIQEALGCNLDHLTDGGWLNAEEREEIAYFLRNDIKKQGYLIQFATPVPTFTGDGKSHYASWGHYKTDFTYSETFEGACKAALIYKKWFYELRLAEHLEKQHGNS